MNEPLESITQSRAVGRSDNAKGAISNVMGKICLADWYRVNWSGGSSCPPAHSAFTALHSAHCAPHIEQFPWKERYFACVGAPMHLSSVSKIWITIEETWKHGSTTRRDLKHNIHPYRPSINDTPKKSKETPRPHWSATRYHIELDETKWPRRGRKINNFVEL